MLQSLGMKYEIYTGVSVGALNAGYLSQFPEGMEWQAAEGLQELWYGIRGNKDIWKHWWFPWVAALWKKSIYNTAPLRALVEKHLDPKEVRASGKKLRVGSVNLNTGQYQIWTEKASLIKEGILGSSAFPGFFNPVDVNEEYHTDGGVRNVTPLKSAIEAGATDIDVILTDKPGMKNIDFSKKKAFHVLIRSLNVMMDEVVENDLKVCEAKNKIEGYKKINLRILRPSQSLGGESLDFDPEQIRKERELGFKDAMAFFGP